MFFKVELLVIFLVVAAVRAEDLPTGWKVCKRSDPELKACLKQALLAVVKSVDKGNEKLGLASVDPIFIQSTTFTDTGSGGPVQLKAVFTNYTVTGFKKVEVQDVEFDVQKLIITTKLFVPLLLVDGKYEMTGKILKLPLSGIGDTSLKLHDVITTSAIELGTVEKTGAKYFQLKKFTMTLATSKTENKFNNLFNGDKKLGDQMNKLINENAEEVYREMGPSINDAYTKTFTPFIKKIFETFPIDVISPP